MRCRPHTSVFSQATTARRNPQSFINKKHDVDGLCRSFSDRIKKVIAAKGDRLKYLALGSQVQSDADPANDTNGFSIGGACSSHRKSGEHCDNDSKITGNRKHADGDNSNGINHICDQQQPRQQQQLNRFRPMRRPQIVCEGCGARQFPDRGLASGVQVSPCRGDGWGGEVMKGVALHGTWIRGGGSAWLRDLRKVGRGLCA